MEEKKIKNSPLHQRLIERNAVELERKREKNKKWMIMLRNILLPANYSFRILMRVSIFFTP